MGNCAAPDQGNARIQTLRDEVHPKMPRRWGGWTVPSAGYAAIACPPEQASQSVCAASADLRSQQLASLRFVETAPDPVGFADLDGVIEAGPLDVAVDADFLRPGFAPQFVLFALEL